MDRNHIDIIAHSEDDRILLARLYDRIHRGIRKNVPACTCFLTPAQQSLARYLFGEETVFFGGYPQAERQAVCYLPDYLDESYLTGEDSPIVCLHAGFYAGDTLTHRDFLGALMGMGIARETVGDIRVGDGVCDFFVTGEIAPFLLQEFTSAGRTKLQLTPVPLTDLQLPEQKTQTMQDTLASLRLDSLIAAGFRISRSAAGQAIAAGKAAINGIPCEKADREVCPGDRISLRGSGKILLESVNGRSRKGRFCVTIQKFV